MIRNRFIRIVTGAVVLILFFSSLYSQEAAPRTFRSEELVSFDRKVSIKTALDILSTYSSRYEKKIIIDPQGYSGPINVLVNRMYWKRALEFILRSNLLEFIEHENYYEVVPLGSAKEEQTIDIFTTSKEVQINAIFFDADYQTLVEAGIDWSTIFDNKVTVNGTFGSETTKNIFSAGYEKVHGKWDVDFLLRTFETLDKGEVIANPQIKVLDGQEGKIKVGTNFFLTTRDFAGNTRFTEYEAGTILYVTPTVLGGPDSTFIHLDIRAERSTVFPDPNAVTKAITESYTQVLLMDGEETVIAGLFSDEVRNIRRGIPLLKDLPPWFFGLRYLFGFESKQVIKKELIILLRAKIVPTIVERMRAGLRKRNYKEEMKAEFRRKLLELKAKNGSTNNIPRNNRNNSGRYRRTK